MDSPATTPGSVSPLLVKETEVLTRKGISPARAAQAIDVQDEVARTNLVRKIEAAMGSAYGGVWFEPAAAQLHIGAMSPKSRRTAEKVVAQTGLSADVVVTPVRSTWAQLIAAQKRWNHRLADLFKREDVETALSAQHNAVSITLSSSVPLAERTALKYEASIADVNIFVSVVRLQKLSITPEAKETKCAKFVTKAANCYKPLTSGVSIQSERVGGKVEVCTAGPMAIPKAQPSQTYLLTAGHCITKGNGLNGKWAAFEPSENGVTEGIIGKAASANFNANGDYGSILIEKGFWTTGIANNPVYAVTAEWKKNAEKSYPVVGEREPMEGAESCHEGQTSGGSCGKVIETKGSIAYNNVKVENLVVVEDAKSEAGDSGGPWMFIEPNSEEPNQVKIEGIDVAKQEGTEFTFFQPLEPTLKALKLKLLTENNEVRKPEFTNCIKVGTKKGDWESSKCTKEKAEGEYEKEKLAAAAKVGLTLSSGETLLELQDTDGIKCTKFEGSGEIQGPVEVAKLKTVLKGCEEVDLKEKCKSGAVAGEIVENPLRGTLEYLNATITKVGLLLEPEEGKPLAQFECRSGEKWKIFGSFICPISPQGQMAETYTLSCNIVTREGFRRQEWDYVEEKGSRHELETSIEFDEPEGCCLDEGSTIDTAATVTPKEAVEINAGSGSPTVTSASVASISEKEATLLATVNPEGAETKYYFEYGTTESYGSKTAEASAGSGTSSIEVSKTITGLSSDTKYHYRFVATNSSGTTYGADQTFTTTYWSAQEPPALAGAKESYLLGSSCTSSTACMAAGWFKNSSEKAVPLAEKWNGTVWSAQEPPAPTGTVVTDLSGVSCTSSAECIAVGGFYNNSGKGLPLAEKWNGTAWSVQEPPSPAGARVSELYSVSCTSSTVCIAVGYFYNSSEKYVPFAEKWNGMAWSVQEPPTVRGATQTYLQGVSCVSSTTCTAVGYFMNSSGKIVPLAESWNGTGWTAHEPPAPTGAKGSELYGVSCISSTECTAVGGFENSSEKGLPLAEKWNGTAWSVQEPPVPTGAKESGLKDVSCTASTACIAVGTFENSAEKSVPLAERWNGAEWSAQEPQGPTGSQYIYLPSVSCTSPTECTAVGYSENSSSTDVPLAERYSN
jgi:hypothetical protein